MLSVVLATYNEEKNIAKCLQSIADIADEIVVVDGSSTDKTVEIAKKNGAKIISTTNKANFHINKQMAMDAAKGELVLQLDADEWPDKEQKKWITSLHTEVVRSGFTVGSTYSGSPVAWWLKRKNFFLGHYFKKGGQYPDPVIRLYIHGYAKLPQKDVHEQMEVKGEIGWAKGHLIHYANPTFSDYLRKFSTYTNFKAQQLEKDNLQISILNTLNYVIYKPIYTFVQLFIRHRGYVDGIPGFVFALMSGLHHQVAYLLLWELREHKKRDSS